jgi:hypothetical protein
LPAGTEFPNIEKMLPCAVSQKLTDVSEVLTASIIRVTRLQVYQTSQKKAILVLSSYAKILCLSVVLSDDAFSVTLDHIASNEMIIDKRRIGKDVEGNSRSLILRFCPGIYLEGLTKSTKTSVRIAGLRAEI